MRLAYRLAKLRFVPQQLVGCGVIGITCVLSSHLLERPDEREWMRDLGESIVTFAALRWLGQQGKRRIDAGGKPLRHPTMKFKLPGAQ